MCRMELYHLETGHRRMMRRDAEVFNDAVELLVGDRPRAHELPR
jgi:hypothetical protein